jgi:mannobiose 2-epimerase
LNKFTPEQIKTLLAYKIAVDNELHAILDWWMNHIISVDQLKFNGKINNENLPIANASIGLVLQCRLLWTFSTAYSSTKNKTYLAFSNTIYIYLIKHFTDKVYGGYYWSVKQNGEPELDKKQIYGLAFAIYGLAAYYEASANKEALIKAEELYRLIVAKSFDAINGGYIECLQRDWSAIEDMRLSNKDHNSIKSMNTHLHVIEAFTKLYSINNNPAVAESIKSLLSIFLNHIIDPKEFQQHLFFSDNWNSTTSSVSFGHDIEASWLLYESALVIGNLNLIETFKNLAIKMASVVAANRDVDGALFHEYDVNTSILNKEKHWWPQAEAMVGFFNAFQLSNDSTFLAYSLESWNFISVKLKDNIYGEWYWGLNEEGKILDKEKAGFWKCPYHNSRACIEISTRIKNLLHQ